MATADFTNQIKQRLLEKRCRLHSLYGKQAVLAQSIDPEAAQPYSVFKIDVSGKLYERKNYDSFQAASVAFNKGLAAYQPPSIAPDEQIRFTQKYDTHRIGFYKNWMVVQPFDEMDGDTLCFLPSDEWDGSDFPDLDYLKGYYTPEWTASNLNEAMEFIDGYDDFEQVNAESLD